MRYACILSWYRYEGSWEVYSHCTVGSDTSPYLKNITFTLSCQHSLIPTNQDNSLNRPSGNPIFIDLIFFIKHAIPCLHLHSVSLLRYFYVYWRTVYFTCLENAHIKANDSGKTNLASKSPPPPFRPPRLILTQPLYTVITLQPLDFYIIPCTSRFNKRIRVFVINFPVSCFNLSLLNSFNVGKLRIWTSFYQTLFPRSQLLYFSF